MLDNLILKFLNNRDVSNFSVKDKIFLFKELAYLLDGWVSVIESIQTIGDTSPNFAVKQVASKLYDSLKSWESLSRGMMRHPQYFDDSDVNIIRSWEGSGELINTLRFLSEEYEFLHTIKGKYTSAMLYPVILLSLSLIAVFFLFVYTLPNIFDLVKDFDVTIPRYTKLIMSTTNFISWNIQLLFVGALIFVIVWVLFFSTEFGKRKRYEFALDAPWFGSMVKYYHMIKFFRYMRLLLQSWMNYVDVLQFLKTIILVPQYQDMIQDVLTGVKKWETIYQNMSFHANIIPADSLLLLKVWEKTANLPSSLNNIVTLYQQDLEKWLNDLWKIIEPILIIFVWFVILLIVVSVFGMIWSILDGVSVTGS